MGREHNSQQLLLLIGCQRSGTHAFSLQLEKVANIITPTETRFPPLFAQHAWLAGDLSKRHNRLRFLRAVFVFLWLWEQRNRTAQQLDDAIPFSLLSLLPECDDIADNTHDLGSLLLALFTRFARRFGAAAVMDKIVHYQADDLGPLLDALPRDTRVIHVVRDGRDVCLSWRKVWFGVKTTAEAAWRWQHHVRVFARKKALLKQRYREVRYEDFLNDPDTVCREVAAWAGLAAAGEAQWTAARKGRFMAEREGHDRLKESIDSSNKDKWKKALSPQELQLFEQLAGDTLAQHGYELTTTPGERSPLAAALALAKAMILYMFRLTTWKRWGVLWLPVILLLSQRLGLPWVASRFTQAQHRVTTVLQADGANHANKGEHVEQQA